MKFLSSLWSGGGRRPAPAGPGLREGERGVALLLTLGILSLLLILGMSFAFSTRTERMAAAVNADLTKARLLAESSLDRAMAYIQTTYASGATLPADLYPATKANSLFLPRTGVAVPAAWSGRYYAVSMNTNATAADRALIESALAVNLGFDFTPAWSNQTGSNRLDANSTPKESWHQLTDPITGNLIGRLAFLIVDESGKIDPNGVVTLQHEPFYDTNGNGSWDTGEYYADVNGDGSYTGSALTEGTDEKRTGASPEEINVANVDSSVFTTPQDFITKMPTNAKRWFSWRHLCAGGISGMTATNAAGVGVRALFPYSQDIEAWNESGTDKHRFDLFSTDWNGMANSIAVLKSGGTGATSNFWTGSPQTVNATATTCIPWLRTVTDAAGTSVSNQVVANLIDYCDSDSATTNDFNGTTATYVGLEKVPYINEVIFDAAYVNGPDELTLSAEVELLNIYDEPFTVPAPAGYLQVVATVRENGINQVRAFTWASPITVDWQRYEQSGTMSVGPLSYPGSVSVQIMDVKIYWASAAAPFTAATLWDYANLSTASASRTFSSTQQRSISCQVVDPRCNTSTAGNWAWTGWGGGGTGSMGSVNDNTDPRGRSPNGDVETVSNPRAGLSTAYIRNGPMKSLWELGAIHRGQQWCTLNLDTYNSTGGTSYKYTDGDANILEQVKLGPSVAGPGKFNANSTQPEAWRAVLKGVTVGAAGSSPTNHGYDAPTTGTALSTANINAMVPIPSAATANTILATNGTTGGTAGGNRGNIASALRLSNGTIVSQDTDREKEEIIGKIANLLTVRQNYFTIVATGQAVKDLQKAVSGLSYASNIALRRAKYYDADGDGDPTTPAAGNANDKWCVVLAEQRLLALVYRDAYSNKFKIERVEYLEE